MSKSLRRSEKWFRRGLWLVAFIFASFLITLGGLLINDLPHVERTLHVEDFLNAEEVAPLREIIRAEDLEIEALQNKRQQANVELNAASELNQSQREALENWVSTRTATDLSDYDNELVERTRALDKLTDHENEARKTLRDIQASIEAHASTREDAYARVRSLEDVAYKKLSSSQDRASLRIFGYRLLLTLPLLLLAGWLFARKRQSKWWPFVWGYIFFSLFVFFVELVPYLPPFGGYVRAVVGVLVTVLVGRYAIVSLQRYLERQREIEAQPDAQRRKELSYDVALARLDKSVCPSCERTVDLTDGVTDFCPHCGICLYDRCDACTARKNAFSKFCFQCGTPEPSNEEPSAASSNEASSSTLAPSI